MRFQAGLWRTERCLLEESNKVIQDKRIVNLRGAVGIEEGFERSPSVSLEKLPNVSDNSLLNPGYFVQERHPDQEPQEFPDTRLLHLNEILHALDNSGLGWTHAIHNPWFGNQFGVRLIAGDVRLGVVALRHGGEALYLKTSLNFLAACNSISDPR